MRHKTVIVVLSLTLGFLGFVFVGSGNPIPTTDSPLPVSSGVVSASSSPPTVQEPDTELGHSRCNSRCEKKKAKRDRRRRDRFNDRMSRVKLIYCRIMYPITTGGTLVTWARVCTN